MWTRRAACSLSFESSSLWRVQQAARLVAVRLDSAHHLSARSRLQKPALPTVTGSHAASWPGHLFGRLPASVNESLSPARRWSLSLARRGAATQSAGTESDNRIAALRVTWWGFGANLGLTGLKYGAGTLAGSSALIADAAHSLSDLVSDFITLFVVQYARVPPDENHPYGHGRFEALGSLAVSGVLISTSFGVGWNALSSLVDCWNGTAAENMLLASGYGSLAVFACLVSLVTKEALYHATVRVGRDINSQTLIANAWHHRSDALSSVAALAGVGGCLSGLPLLDPVSGLLVSAMVAKAGVEIGWESLSEVAERTDLHDPTLKAVRTIASSTEGVLGLRHLRARKMGPYSLVDLHVDVDPLISVSAAHHVAERVRHAIVTSESHVSEVLVHVEPHEQADVDASIRPHTEVEREIHEILARVPDIQGVSHINCHYVASKGIHVKVDIVCDDSLSIKQASGIAREAKLQLLKLKDVFFVDVDLELDV